MKPKFPTSSQPIPTNATKIFKGKIFDIWQWEQVMFDGSTQTFEKAKRTPSVGILSVNTKGKILVTIQEQPLVEPFIGLLGGVVDEGESIEEAAERELMEEAGLKAKKIDFWFSVQPITKVEWPVYLFVARECKRVSKQNLDSGEKIKLKYVDWDEFLDLIKQDNFRDTEIALKILRAMRNKDELEKIKSFIFQ